MEVKEEESNTRGNVRRSVRGSRSRRVCGIQEGRSGERRGGCCLWLLLRLTMPKSIPKIKNVSWVSSTDVSGGEISARHDCCLVEVLLAAVMFVYFDLI